MVPLIHDLYTAGSGVVADSRVVRGRLSCATYCLSRKSLFPLAHEFFTAFIGDYPDSTFTENCHHWLAWLDCFDAYAMRHVDHLYMDAYRRALAHYDWITENGAQDKLVGIASSTAATIRLRINAIATGQTRAISYVPSGEFLPFLSLAAIRSLQSDPQESWNSLGPQQVQQAPQPAGGREQYFRFYIVQPGDTLKLIAGRELGEAARWKEIASLNPTADGADSEPEVGSRLILPR